MSTPPSGYLLGLSALVRSAVEFVIVGVGGINFYARDPAQAFATLDLDLLLEPLAPNLSVALRALADHGYRFEAGGEPFLDLDDAGAVGALVQRGASVAASHEEGGQLDLMLSMRGFAYADLAEDASRFRLGGIEVRVGRLEKLLRSKELSARPKDIEFLRRFVARAEDEQET